MASCDLVLGGLVIGGEDMAWSQGMTTLPVLPVRTSLPPMMRGISISEDEHRDSSALRLHGMLTRARTSR